MAIRAINHGTQYLSIRMTQASQAQVSIFALQQRLHTGSPSALSWQPDSCSNCNSSISPQKYSHCHCLDKAEASVRAHQRWCRNPAYEALAPACKRLSQALQVLEDLKRDVLEESEKRTAAERAATRATARVTDLRTALSPSGSGADAVQQLRSEADRLRELANSEYPKCAASSPFTSPVIRSSHSLCPTHRNVHA